MSSCQDCAQPGKEVLCLCVLTGKGNVFPCSLQENGDFGQNLLW